MIYHRNKPGRERSLPQVRTGKPSVRKGPIGFVVIKGTLDKEDICTSPGDEVDKYSEEQQDGRLSAPGALWDFYSSMRRTTVGAEHRYAPQTSQPFPDTQVQKVACPATRDAVEDEPIESQGQRMLRMVVARIEIFTQIGDSVDPFVVLPQFNNPKLDSLYLQRNYKCTHEALICEAMPLSMSTTWELSEYALGNDDVTISTSPLFCPRADFVTVANDSCVLLFTYEILRDMQDLTSLSIAHRAVSKIIRDTCEIKQAHNDRNEVDYDDKVTKLGERLTKLPSAYIPGLP